MHNALQHMYALHLVSGGRRLCQDIFYRQSYKTAFHLAKGDKGERWEDGNADEEDYCSFLMPDSP
jgi:hypothetical protein